MADDFSKEYGKEIEKKEKEFYSKGKVNSNDDKYLDLHGMTRNEHALSRLDYSINRNPLYD